MPTPRVASENRIVNPQPKQEQWAVIVPQFLWVDPFPNVGGKIVRHLVPGMDRGILHNLTAVIVNKLVTEAGKINRKS